MRQRPGTSVCERGRSREAPILFLVCFISALLFGAAILASEVSEGETRAFDRTILLALRATGNPSDPIGPAWLEIVMRDITSLGSTTVISLITMLVLIYFALVRRFLAAALVLAAIVGGTVVSSALKVIVGRPRPDLVSHLVDVQTMSFPSGHAMLSAVTYLTLGALLARQQTRRPVRIYVMIVAVILTVLIGCSRVYLGVHWPTDVLAGWAIGAAWAMLWSAVAWRIMEKSDQSDDPF